MSQVSWTISNRKKNRMFPCHCFPLLALIENLAVQSSTLIVDMEQQRPFSNYQHSSRMRTDHAVTRMSSDRWLLPVTHIIPALHISSSLSLHLVLVPSITQSSITASTAPYREVAKHVQLHHVRLQAELGSLPAAACRRRAGNEHLSLSYNIIIQLHVHLQTYGYGDREDSSVREAVSPVHTRRLITVKAF